MWASYRSRPCANLPLRFNTTWGSREIYSCSGTHAQGLLEKHYLRSEIQTRVLDDFKCECVTYWAIGVHSRSITELRIILRTIHCKDGKACWAIVLGVKINRLPSPGGSLQHYTAVKEDQMSRCANIGTGTWVLDDHAENNKKKQTGTRCHKKTVTSLPLPRLPTVKRTAPLYTSHG